ncbi:MAG: family virulence protein [Caulobacteraceae bacterium]|nr:family virulence protein [Caulobacteraceae bacterium]
MNERPLQIRGIDHLLLMVDDIERAIDFYQGVLGCTLKSRLPQFGMAELAAGSAGLDLVDIASKEGAWARPAAAHGANLHHVCLAVDVADEAALRAHLAAHAAPILEERFEDGHLSLYVADPGGNQVELRFIAGGSIAPEAPIH